MRKAARKANDGLRRGPWVIGAMVGQRNGIEIMLSRASIQSGESLDRFALTASQHYNLGNQGNWFFSFRGGYFGVIARVNGLIRHSRSLHSWYEQSSHSLHEHDLAVVLFCMDS